MKWFSAMVGLFLIVGCQNNSEAPVSPIEDSAWLAGNHISSDSQAPNLQRDLAALASASASAKATAKVDNSQSTAHEKVTKTFNLGQNSSTEINVRVKVKVKTVTHWPEEVSTKAEEVVEQPCETCQEKVAEEPCNECQEETHIEHMAEEETSCPCGYETEYQAEWIPQDEKPYKQEEESYEDCQTDFYQAHAEASASASADSCQCECNCQTSYHAGLAD